MPHHHRVLAVLLLFGSAISTATAQESLRALEASFAEKRAAAAQAAGGFIPYDQFQQLSRAFATDVAAYLKRMPAAPDRVEARMSLATALLQIGDREPAASALKDLDPAEASMTGLLNAADLAGKVGLDAQRGAWIDAAMKKQAPFDERMRAGMLLMTKLAEPKRAEALFEGELKKAADDDARATVMWHAAAAVREREDREEGDYEKALDALAKKYPKTMFGGIASDRLRAMAYEVGQPAVEIAGKDLSGAERSLSALRGKVVLVWFWSSASAPSREALPRMVALAKKFEGRGVEVLGVALDVDKAALDSFLAKNPMPWPNVFDGRGLESPLALRANVDQVPGLWLVGKEGAIAALRLDLIDDAEAAHVAEQVEKALGAGGEK